MTETSQNVPPLPRNIQRFENLAPGPQENPDAPPAPFSPRTSAQRVVDNDGVLDWFNSPEYQENALHI